MILYNILLIFMRESVIIVRKYPAERPAYQEREMNMELHITCIPGDGIGPEIVREAKKVLEKIAVVYGHKMVFEDILMGGASIDVHGVPLTEEAIAKAKAADAVLMGSIGGDTTKSPW